MSRLRALPPGGESKYCFTRSPENPPTPPKYCMTISSTSAEWGMLAPPRITLSAKISTPASSIFLRPASRREAAFFLFFLERSFRQSRQTYSHSCLPSLLRTTKCSVVFANARPQWVQGTSMKEGYQSKPAGVSSFPRQPVMLLVSP